MSISNYPKGFADGVNVRGIPILNLYPGVVFWVDSVHGSNGNSKGTFDRPFGTIDYAIGRCTADHGDLIVVKAGHTETVAAAAGLAFDVAGIGVYFLGAGSNKATITFTAAAATMVVSAANVTLIQPRFLTGIDAVVAAINVQAADFQMYNTEYYDAAAKATTIQVLTTAAADRMVIDGYKFFVSTTGTAKTDGIKTVAGDSIVLRNIDINGDFSTSPIDISTAATKLTLENINVNNVNIGPLPAITLHLNTTGFAKNVKTRVASGTTYISDVAKIQWADDCEGFSTDGYGGEPLGTVLGTGLEGKIDVIDGYFDVPTADAAPDVTIRDVVGRKTDVAINAVTTSKSLMAYLKGIVNEITVPGVDNIANGFMNDVIGQKSDAAATGAVTTADTLVGYIKQLITEGIARDAAIAVIDDFLDTEVAAILADTTTIGDTTLPVAPVAGSLARFVASGGTALGTQLPDSKSLYDMVKQYGVGSVVTKTLATGAAGAATLFTVTGEVEVVVAGYIDAAVTSAGALTLEVGVAGATAGLIAQTGKAALLIDLVWVNATPAVLVAKPVVYVIANGADIIQTVGAGDATAGAVTYYCYWRPLSADGNVVAA